MDGIRELYSWEIAERFTRTRRFDWEALKRRIAEAAARVLVLPLYGIVPDEEYSPMALKIPKVRPVDRIKADYKAALSVLRSYAGLVIHKELIDGLTAELSSVLHVDFDKLRPSVVSLPELTPTGVKRGAWRLAGNLEIIKAGGTPHIWSAGQGYEGWAAAEITQVSRGDDGKLTVWLRVLSGPFSGHGLGKEVSGNGGLRLLRTMGVPAKREVPFEYLAGSICYILLEVRAGDEQAVPRQWKCTTSQTEANKLLLSGRDTRPEGMCKHHGDGTRCRECTCGREFSTIAEIEHTCKYAVNLYPLPGETSENA
jgi:hypothetical protein